MNDQLLSHIRDRLATLTRIVHAHLPRWTAAQNPDDALAVELVVNLRLKGCGKFWLRENAEAMLLVRSYLKSGRQTDLLSWSLRTAASWWGQPPSAPVLVDVDGNTAAHDFQAAS